jgi:hypothetical protein
MKQRVSLEAQDEVIRQMAAEGAPAPEIAAATGAAAGSIVAYLRKHGIERKTDRSRWAEKPSACRSHHDTVKSMAEAGATLDAIGEAVGTTKNRVRQYLTRHGIERPDWRNPPPDSHPMARRTEGELNSQWNGGRSIDKDGYVLLWMPGHPEANRHGQVREHRIVMAKTLGRPLLPGEVVDHRNGLTGDNRPENLRLFASNGEHLSVTLTGQKSRESRGLPPATHRKSATGGQRSPGSNSPMPA